MKKLLPIIIILLASCSSPYYKPILEPLTAEVTITDIYQDYYSSLDEYGMVELFYEIRNTSTRTINYYEVYFTVTCDDNSTYIDWTNGLYITPGQISPGYIIIYTSWKKYKSIKVNNIILE